MFVGAGRITLSLQGTAHGGQSLKAKRKVVRRVLDRTRAKFNVAAAEVDAMDQHQRAVLGFVVVSNEAAHANSMLDKIMDYVSSHPEAPVVDRTLTIVPIGGGADGLDEYAEYLS